MRPTWGPSGADRTQVDPMLAPWILLSRFRQLSVTCSTLSHYLKQCGIINDWSFRNTLLWTFNKKRRFSFKENAFENVISTVARLCLSLNEIHHLLGQNGGSITYFCPRCLSWHISKAMNNFINCLVIWNDASTKIWKIKPKNSVLQCSGGSNRLYDVLPAIWITDIYTASLGPSHQLWLDYVTEITVSVDLSQVWWIASIHH